MASGLVSVPASLLLNPGLPASAKLIWMVLRLHNASEPPGTTWLVTASGLSRPTVLKGLTQLKTAGWDPAAARASFSLPTGNQAAPEPRARRVARASATAGVPIPASLLTDTRLSASARVLYGLLLLTPGFSHPSGQTRYGELAALARVSRNPVDHALGQLAQAEWIKLERQHRLAPIHFELTFPGFARGLETMDRAQDRLSKAPHRGEALMREYLSLLVDSDDYEDDAAPGFLVSPRTLGRLELDRFYPPKAAFEFNGPQHYRATGRFTGEQSAEQRERDYIKLGICATRGITLVVVHPDDLALKTMQQKVGGLLPLRDLTGYDLLIDCLELEGLEYRGKVSKL